MGSTLSNTSSAEAIKKSAADFNFIDVTDDGKIAWLGRGKKGKGSIPSTKYVKYDWPGVRFSIRVSGGTNTYHIDIYMINHTKFIMHSQ